MIKHFLVLALPLLVTSWWDVGHMLTAAIAEIRMNQLNMYASGNFGELTLAINHLCDNRSRTFIESAVWADDIKQKQPYLTDAIIPVLNYTAISVNSITTINQAKIAIKTKIKTLTAERSLFARYLVHMIGDVHQPLHSVALFNRTYPKGDAGGNLIKLQMLNGSMANFHSFWDSGAFLLQNDTYQFPRPMTLQNLTEIKRFAAELIKNYGKQVEQNAKILDPLVWIKQAFLIAQNTTYPFLMKTNRANEEYTNLVYETSKKQITMAGYRLANVVIDIFDPTSKLLTSEIEQNWKILYQHAKQVHQKQRQIQDNFSKNLITE